MSETAQHQTDGHDVSLKAVNALSTLDLTGLSFVQLRRLHKVLLPKDSLRLRMTGDYASDMSDSAGTLWLDVARRSWSTEMLEACGLSTQAMPALFEGSEATGALRRETSAFIFQKI